MKYSKKKGWLYYINHKNLISEIENYGYVFNLKKLIFTYIFVIGGCIFAGILYKLPTYGYAVILILALLQTPFLIINYYKGLYEQRKFSDTSKYIERMLYYFKANRKILNSLIDVEKVFPNGQMKASIHKAIEYIENKFESNVERGGLNIIEHEYGCSRIVRLHNFLLDIEYNGGDAQMGIDALLKDRQIWTDTKVLFQKEKRNIKTCGIVSILVSLSMCLVTLYIPSIVKMQNIDISSSGIVQVSAICLILYFLRLYRNLDKKLCKNLVEDKVNHMPEYYEKMYITYINYDIAKIKNKCIILSTIPALLGFAAYVITKNPVCIAAGILIIVLIVSYPELNYKLTFKAIKSSIQEEFPMWIIQIALNMQNNNVAMSVAKTYDTAPGILRPAIAKFLTELEKMPESVEPYNNFLSELNITEVNEVMGILYSIRSGAGGDIEREFKTILEKNNKLLERAEKSKNEDKISIMKNISITKPAMAGAVKMLIDMTVLVVSFFNMASSIM